VSGSPASLARACRVTAEPQLIVSCPVRRKVLAPTAAYRDFDTCFPCCGGCLEHGIPRAPVDQATFVPLGRVLWARVPDKAHVLTRYTGKAFQF